MALKQRRSLPKAQNRSVTMDVAADAAVQALQRREGLTYSAALGALVVHAALDDPGLREAIREALAVVVSDRLKVEGYDPDIGEMLAAEITQVSS